MSETKDEFFYNLYDFSKSVYLFSHMKTNLVDENVQVVERFAVNLLAFISSVIFGCVVFKSSIIIVYFLGVQAMPALYRYIKLLIKTKFSINFKNSCKNALMFLIKVSRKICTFNFYIFYSKFVSGIMIVSFLICLFSNFMFGEENKDNLENTEKPKSFLVFYFLSFELNLLIELILSTFYSHRNLVSCCLLAFGYYIVINFIMIIVYSIASYMEYLDGAFLYEEPQRILNIIVFSILFVLKANCLYKIIEFKKRSKCIINLFNIFLY